MEFSYSVVVLLLSGLCLSSGEVFTSMADMEQMVVTEKKMLEELKNYIEAEEEKLDAIKTFMSNVDGVLENVNKTDDVGKYLGNPVNSYLMLKRFNVDWKNLEKTLEADFADNLNSVFETLRPFFPTAEDHEGAMDALFRLQKTYNLKSDALAKGVIPGVAKLNTHPLSLQDIFELGVYAYKTRDWPHAIQWLQTALEKMGNREVIANIEKTNVMDYLAYALFEHGDIKKALEMTEILVTLKPDDGRIANNLDYFRDQFQLLDDQKAEEVVEKSEKKEFGTQEEREETLRKYRKLCRGEARNVTRSEERKMKCWYRTKHPLLKLKPQKVERLWVTPEILLFHDLIREDQSEWIKKTAHPMLRRATIQDPITGKLRYADYRVSKSAWLDPDQYSVVGDLKVRAQAVTGLDLKSAEQLQIANYGMGGHYEPHFDHARDDEDAFTSLGMGNRIATLLFYISDVPTAGGATVFTNAHAAVFPVRNAAVFWYNLHRNGQGNVMTRHAACPVLAGQKWVSNWWIHEYGQFNKRRCALNKEW